LLVIIIVDERELVTSGYESSFCREGISAMGFGPHDFTAWMSTAAPADLGAVEAFLLGDCHELDGCTKLIGSRSKAPVIALNENPGLDHTLKLFAAGVDDVVRKPVHVREILARVEAIRRRRESAREDAANHVDAGEIRVFSDGRDPVVGGEVLLLPRRERRILEFLVSCRGRLVSKSQIFSSIYGLFDEDVQENVIESHISKLRKKLRSRLGYDPIESKRYLGYRLLADPAQAKADEDLGELISDDCGDALAVAREAIEERAVAL
jgi:two-component system, OmpR family, flagellar system response regulator FtcR